MDITKLRHVTALARLRSYTRAADALGITQSALTRSIQSLESSLALRLFDRDRGGVVVTPAGQQLAREAEDVLQRVRTLERNMSLMSGGKIGDVAFGMGPLPATILLPGLLSRALREHGDVRIRTVVGSAPDLLRQLKADELEFVIASRDMLDAGGMHTCIASIGWVELAALVRRGHPLARRRVSDKDLADFPVIGGSPMDPLGAARQPGYRPTVMCDNYDVLRNVTLQSDAIWIAARCLARDELVALRGASIAKPNELIAVAPVGRTLSPVASKLVDDCRQLLAKATKA
jgi:DNA-binding transcriptional LysR family regulator